MTDFVFANFYNTTLASPLSSGGTSMTVASSSGLPTLSAGQVLALILLDAATRTVHEVVYVTAISGANLTITRGEEGTAAVSWTTGDYVYQDVTQATVAAANGNPTNVFDVANATAATNAVSFTQGLAFYSNQVAFTSSTTWTVPALITRIKIRCWGGGGGGGGSGGVYGGAGGAGGNYSESVITGLTPGATLTITIGAAGTAGSGATAGNGGAGGTSSVANGASTLVLANGGGGGTGGANGPPWGGGLPGAAGTGTIQGTGAHGAGGGDSSYTNPMGGGAAMGGGGGGGPNAGASTPGFPGGGGAGALGGAAGAGAAGAAGYIVIDY